MIIIHEQNRPVRTSSSLKEKEFGGEKSASGTARDDVDHDIDRSLTKYPVLGVLRTCMDYTHP